MSQSPQQHGTQAHATKTDELIKSICIQWTQLAKRTVNTKTTFHKYDMHINHINCDTLEAFSFPRLLSKSPLSQLWARSETEVFANISISVSKTRNRVQAYHMKITKYVTSRHRTVKQYTKNQLSLRIKLNT